MEVISFEQEKLKRAASKPIYFANEILDRAAIGLAALKPCPFAGVVTADQVKLALGELLDIWPASIAAAELE
jgi:hypothetical protein